MPALADTQNRLVRRKAVKEDEWSVFDDIPCFAEHVADDGTVYDRQKLEAICANQNRRIQDTGDFTPIVVGHTPDQHEKKDPPPIIGYAGPFRMGKVGNVRPRWAILAKFRVFKSDEETFRKHPRRSVELWVEDDPKDRFFDPISVLGAETPRLDLGMAYSRVNPKRKIARYSAVAPSGTNTFVPSLGDDKKQKHDKESGMALAPEDINQIIEALKSTAEFQFIQQQMQAAAGGGAGLPGDPGLPGDGLGAEPPPDAAAAGAPPAGPDAGPPPPDAGAPPAGDGLGALDQDPLTEKDHVELMRKYAKDGDAEGFDAYYGTLDEESRKKCMAYAMGAGAEPDPDPDTDKEPEKPKMNYQKERDEYRQKYAMEKRRADEVVAKYDRLAADVADLKSRERTAVRYAKLKDLADEGFNFDADEEVKDCAEMDDAAFEKHQTRIRANYSRVPINRPMPHQKPEQYAKDAQAIELSNKAAALAQAEGITYAAARAKVAAAAGK